MNDNTPIPPGIEQNDSETVAEILGAPLYRESDIEQRPDDIVFLLSNPADADRLAAFGYLASCYKLDNAVIRPNPVLNGRYVVIVAEDTPAVLLEAELAKAFQADSTGGGAAAVKIVTPPGGSFADWMDANQDDTDAFHGRFKKWALPGTGRSLLDINREVTERGPDANELIKDRFMCRGAVGLLTAETSMGKSSLIVQAAVSWAMGRPAFGMEPTQPFRTLIFQQENDDYDLAEEIKGQLWGQVNKNLLTRAEVEKAMCQVQVISDRSNYGDAFIKELSFTLAQADPPFDLVIIDPLFGFAGCDILNQKEVTHFLRNQILPLVSRFNVAMLLVHHKTKSNKNAATNRDYNQSYDYHGSAELANFSRFSLVLDRYQGDEGEYFFTLRAPKRGGRLAWPNKEVYMKWSKEAIFWEELDEKPPTGNQSNTSAPAARKRQKEEEDRQRLDEQVAAAIDLLEPGQAVTITNFRSRIQGCAISLNKSRIETIIEMCVHRGFMTRRPPNKAQGEGGRGVSTMIERPKDGPTQGTFELSPDLGKV